MSETTDLPTYLSPSTPTFAGGNVDWSSIPPAAVGGTTAASMFGGLFWMLATGRLYTGASHREVMAIKDQTISTQNTTIEVKDKQLENLAVVGETVVKILHSLEGPPTRAGS